jgi:hypothetical protein
MSKTDNVTAGQCPMKPSSKFLPLFILAVTFAYSVFRYHVFKGVAWGQLPFYTLNKAVAWSALTLLAVAARGAVRSGEPLAEQPVLRPALVMMSWHTVSSLALLAAGAYPEFLVGGHLSAKAGASFALGAVGAVAAQTGLRGPKSAAFAAVLAAASATHAGLLGLSSWFSPERWPGHMPPITLLSTMVGFVALAWAVWLKSPLRPTSERSPSPAAHPAPVIGPSPIGGRLNM